MIKRGAVLVAALVAIKAQALMNDDTSSADAGGSGAGGGVQAWATWAGVRSTPSQPAAKLAWGPRGAGAALSLLERDMPWRRGGWMAGSRLDSLVTHPAPTHADVGRLLAQTGGAVQRMSDAWPAHTGYYSGWSLRTRSMVTPPQVIDGPRSNPGRGGVVPLPSPSSEPGVIVLPPNWGGLGPGGADDGDGASGGTGGSAPQPDAGGGWLPGNNPIGGEALPGLGLGTPPVPEAETWAMAVIGVLLCLGVKRLRPTTPRRPH